MSWPTVRIGDVADVLPGYAFKSKELGEEGSSLIKIGNILDGGNVDLSNCQRLPKNHYLKKYEKFKLRDRDIVIAMTGATAGKVGRIRAADDEDLLLNQRVAKFAPRTVNADFLWFAIGNEKYRAKFYSLGGGAAQPNMSGPQIAAVEIPYPDLPIQERIAGILSAYDDLIENNRRRIALLEQAAQLLYREWFVHFRFPGHETAKFVDGLPEGWERVRLESVCARITDGSHASPKSVDAGFPMASVKDMHDWGIDTKGCRLISHDDFDKLVKADCKPLVNDVLIAKDGSYLKHCFVIQKEIDLVILSSIAILRPNDRIDPHYLSFTLREPHIKERMKGYVSGAALPRIILREFRGFEIVLPSDQLQGEWATRVHPIAQQCGKLIAQNEELTKARDLLLPRLMDGRIPVKV